jgi:hypothetical protein
LNDRGIALLNDLPHLPAIVEVLTECERDAGRLGKLPMSIEIIEAERLFNPGNVKLFEPARHSGGPENRVDARL